MASEMTLLIIHRTEATWRATRPPRPHKLLGNQRGGGWTSSANAGPDSSPESRNTCVFGDGAPTLLGSGFPVVFESELEQTTTSTDILSREKALETCGGSRELFWSFPKGKKHRILF